MELDISADDLIFLIKQNFPDAVHGVDFWCGHPVDDGSGERSGPAFIAQWNLDGSPPEEAELQTLLTSHAVALEADRTARKSNQARARRDALLSETDWHVTRAIESGSSVPAGMTTYRQALRDVPEQEGFPDNITWPEAPQ